MLWYGACTFSNAVKNLIFAVLLASFANAQATLRNSVTFSVGSALSGPRQCCQYNTTLSLGATYDFRVFRYLQVEAGITTALHPTPELRGATFDIQPTDRFLWVPFGFQGALPLWAGRLEVLAGGGGIFENYSAGNIPPFIGAQSENAWGGYLKLGAATAIGRSRHFWLGASAREFLGNRAHANHDQWMVVTVDFSFRF
jgi:hypothetical protein